jgi:hypothetical protein
MSGVEELGRGAVTPARENPDAAPIGQHEGCNVDGVAFIRFMDGLVSASDGRLSAG